MVVLVMALLSLKESTPGAYGLGASNAAVLISTSIGTSPDCDVCGFRKALEYAPVRRNEYMASMQTSRGRKQDRARVAGGQGHEVRYESMKSGKSRAAVKKAVRKVGTSRRKVERELAR
jgi:hypothetical protein